VSTSGPSAEWRHHRFTVDEYYRMTEAGILPEDTSTELIEGRILDVGERVPFHSGTMDRMNRILLQRVGDSAVVGIKHAVRFDPYTEPIADYSILRARSDFYSEAHPGPEDVLLMIEVAGASLAYDRDAKAPLYAGAGIPEYWLVDLAGREVIVHRSPLEGRYSEVTNLGRGDAAALQTVPGLTLSVDEIFG
jgi:Uma2 family endonuclease